MSAPPPGGFAVAAPALPASFLPLGPGAPPPLPSVFGAPAYAGTPPAPGAATVPGVATPPASLTPPKPLEDETVPPGCNLLVTGLSVDPPFTDAALEAMFEPFGPILSTVAMVDTATGKGRGFGFVLLCAPAQAQLAITKLDGSAVPGCPGAIRVQVSQHRGAIAPSSNVFVRNLPPDLTRDHANVFFGNLGTITALVLCEDRSAAAAISVRKTQQATIDYATVEEAANAIRAVKRCGGTLQIPASPAGPAHTYVLAMPLFAKFGETSRSRRMRRENAGAKISPSLAGRSAGGSGTAVPAAGGSGHSYGGSISQGGASSSMGSMHTSPGNSGTVLHGFLPGFAPGGFPGMPPAFPGVPTGVPGMVMVPLNAASAPHMMPMYHVPVPGVFAGHASHHHHHVPFGIPTGGGVVPTRQGIPSPPGFVPGPPGMVPGPPGVPGLYR